MTPAPATAESHATSPTSLLKTVAIAGLGGGGCNIAVCASAHFQKMATELNPNLRDNVSTVLVDTNKFALAVQQRECPQARTLVLGTGLGAGCVPKRGEAAMEAGKEQFVAAFRGHKVVFLCIAAGKGTATGGIIPAVLALKEQGHIVWPIVVMPSRDHEGADVATIKHAEELIVKLDSTGIRYAKVNNDYAFGESMSPSEGYNLVNDALADAIAGMACVFAAPTQSDESDILFQVYPGGGPIGLTSFNIPKELLQGDGPEQMQKISEFVQKLCKSDLFEFPEMGPVGGTLAVVHGKLTNRQVSAVHRGVANFRDAYKAHDESRLLRSHYSPNDENVARVTLLYTLYREVEEAEIEQNAERYYALVNNSMASAAAELPIPTAAPAAVAETMEVAARAATPISFATARDLLQGLFLESSIEHTAAKDQLAEIASGERDWPETPGWDTLSAALDQLDRPMLRRNLDRLNALQKFRDYLEEHFFLSPDKFSISGKPGQLSADLAPEVLRALKEDKHTLNRNARETALVMEKITGFFGADGLTGFFRQNAEDGGNGKSNHAPRFGLTELTTAAAGARSAQ